MSDSDFDRLCSVAGPVSRETFTGLKAFEAEFRRWNARINLTAPSTLPELWERHILDSAQIFPLGRAAGTWLDLGSGGGFPGAILAVMLREVEGASMTLVESNRKKAAFLQTVLSQLQAPAHVVATRIEDAAKVVAPVEIVTARALAPLSNLLELAAPWLSSGATALFHKGRDFESELANCADAWRFDLIQHRSRIDSDSVILEISNLVRRG